MAVHYLGDNNPDGMCVGTASTELVAFHGATPTDQYATTAAVSTSAVTAATGAFGFATTAQATALIGAVNDILALLKEKGLMASS